MKRLSYREALRIAPSAALRHQLGVAVARQTEFAALNDRLRAAPSAEVATGVLEDMLRLNPRSALAHGELGTEMRNVDGAADATAARFRPT